MDDCTATPEPHQGLKEGEAAHAAASDLHGAPAKAEQGLIFGPRPPVREEGERLVVWRAAVRVGLVFGERVLVRRRVARLLRDARDGVRERVVDAVRFEPVGTRGVARGGGGRSKGV
eukprot:6213061-Pleurochrysis_carterae.AAC.5